MTKAAVLLVLLLAPIGCGDDGGESSGSGATGGTAGAGGSAGSSTGGTAGSGGTAGGGATAGGGGTAGVAGGGGAAGSGGTGGVAIDCASGDILAYSFGNQITSSKLNIKGTGEVTHVEHICCPPADEDQNASPLDANALATLKVRIEAAKSGTISTKDGSPTSLGSSSGTLAVCAADGTPLIVRNVIRNLVVGQPDQIEVNSAPEAEEIRVFVTDAVDEDMPGG